jgi:hypothetical protein
VRFALVSYRDHPPQDTSYVTKTFKFTDSLSVMESYVQTMSANGGGDGPEAVTAAMQACLDLSYRPNATKFVIIIADAPPHGVGEGGDGFPNGDPNGLDPVVIAHDMLKRGIVLYVAACEPALSQYQYGIDFFTGVTKITEGKILPLTSASLLAEVVVGGAAEEASLEAMMAEVELEAAQLQQQRRGAGQAEFTMDELADRCTSIFQSKGHTTSKVAVDDIGYGARDQSNVAAMLSSPSLSEARGKFKNIVLSAPPGGRASPFPTKMKRRGPTIMKRLKSMFESKDAPSIAPAAPSAYSAAPLSCAAPPAYSAAPPSCGATYSAAPPSCGAYTEQACYKSKGSVDRDQMSRMLRKSKARSSCS